MDIMNKGICILQIGEQSVGFLNMDFAKRFRFKPSEIEFIEKLIPLQISKGFDDWMILKIDDMSEQFDIPRPTLARYMQKLKQSNILIQEDFRSPLWKFNPNLTYYEKR